MIRLNHGLENFDSPLLKGNHLIISRRWSNIDNVELNIVGDLST